MQRNIRSEIFVALGVLVFLAFVVVSAQFLASRDLASTVTATPTVGLVVDGNLDDATPTLISLATLTTATPRAIVVTSTPSSAELTLTHVALTAGASATVTPSVTATARASATFTPSVTATVRASATFAPNATATPSVTATARASATTTNLSCVPPTGWFRYTVEAGNTLFAIALAVNSTVRELQEANCLADADVIKSGQVLYLPRLPIRPVSTAASGVTRRVVLGCLSGDALIVSPVRGQRLSGVFAVQGTASRADFWYYKLEVRREGVEVYDFYSDSYAPVINGVLGEIDARRFGTGEYWVRLSVVDLAGRILPDMFCEIPIVFE